MARVVVNSNALLREAEKVDRFRVITLAVCSNTIELHSTYHYHSKVEAVRNNVVGIKARVRAEDLVAILRQIEDQPITLDLHSNIPAQSAGRVYALKFKEPGNPFGGYEQLDFDFKPYL